SELWVRFSNQPNKYAVLAMPGCRLSTVELPQPTYHAGSGVDFTIDVTSVIPGGRAIVQKYWTKEARRSWWLIPGPPADGNSWPLLALEPPDHRFGPESPPILSTDGDWLAWLGVIPGAGQPVLHRVFLQPRDSRQKERIVDLSALGPATYIVEKL